MSTTLAEYEDLCTDALKKGIAKTILTESPWLQAMPFVPIASNSIKYKMEKEAAGADFYEVGETWIEGTPTWEDRYADLTILGGDADVDNFAKAGMQIEASDIIALKAKAIADRFNACAVMGRTTAVTTYSSSKIFKGIARLIAEAESDTTTDLDGVNNAQVYANHATSAVLTIDALDSLIALVKPKPTHLIMNTSMRNKLNSLARAAGSNLTVANGQLGSIVEMYGTYPILIDDQIGRNINDGSSSVLTIASYTPTTARAATLSNSMIFAVKFGEDGLCGITSASDGMLQTVDIGQLESKDAKRTRIKFYCGMALFNKRAAAVMINVEDADL